MTFPPDVQFQTKTRRFLPQVNRPPSIGQGKKIKDTLTFLLDNDYIFIDLPYYSNIGDSLIWKGTETLLASLPHKCLYRASCKTFRHIDISENVIIIMMGGGNWGDLYLIHNEFRKRIVQSYPNNKIIILPQTVYYEGARNARFDAKVFRKHKRLIQIQQRYQVIT